MRPTGAERRTPAVTAAVGAGVALSVCAGSPAAALGELARADAAGFAPAVSAAAALLAWSCLVYVAIVLALELAAGAPGRIGLLADWAADRLAPRAVRSLAQAALALGVSVAPAAAASGIATPTAVAATPLTAPDGGPASAIGAPPTLDWPFVAADAAATAPPSGPALDRPIAPFVASPPPQARRIAPSMPATVLARAPHAESVEDGYVVRRGDSLWAIAARHLGPDASAADIAREWPRWYAANHAVVGSDPNLLRAGEVLYPPTSAHH